MLAALDILAMSVCHAWQASPPSLQAWGASDEARNSRSMRVGHIATEKPLEPTCDLVDCCSVMFCSINTLFHSSAIQQVVLGEGIGCWWMDRNALGLWALGPWGDLLALGTLHLAHREWSCDGGPKPLSYVFFLVLQNSMEILFFIFVWFI